MLGSVGSVVPKRWILGIFALGLIAVMVATSANPWASAAALPSAVTATALSPTSIQVNWTAADPGSTVPGSGVIDAYRVDCVGTPGTQSTTVTGIATGTATVTGLTANTAYVCSVFASSTGTLPGTGVAAASQTTPLSLATQLGSIVISPSSSTIQVGGTQVFTATVRGADTSNTPISGLTVNWTISGNGTISASTGDSITYTSTAAGSGTLSATVTQGSTNITKNAAATITNFSPPPAPPSTPPSDPPASEIPTPPSLGGNAQASTGVIKPSAGASLTVPSPVTGAEFNFATDATVDVPTGAVPNGQSFAIVTELVPRSGGTTVTPTTVDQTTFVPLPAMVTRVNAEPLTIQLVGTDGNEVTGVTFNESVTVGLTVPVDNLSGANLDPQSVSIFKASNPATDPWTELSTTFSIVNGKYKFSAQTRTFSTFILGSTEREVGLPGEAAGAVLPSAGDWAPTTAQAMGAAALGLVIAAGGAAYVRRRRRAGEAG